MKRYILFGANQILDREGNVNFSVDSEHRFAVAYRAWLAAGNTPDPDPNASQKTKDAMNSPILQQIAVLEASCTERRWREHITGINTVFIPNIETQIALLRAGLV